MSKQEIQFPNWTFTASYGGPGQLARDDVQAFYDDVCGYATYVIAGWEKAPTTNQLHLQGYVQFETKKRLTQLKKFLNGATVHWEVAKGDEEQNYTYCTKDGEFMEYGEARVVNGGKREAKRWKKALDLAKQGTYDDIDAQIQLQFCKQLDYIRDRHAGKPVDLPHTTRHLWIWGPSGSGKSREARSIFAKDPWCGNFYNKLQNKWWDHYNDNRVPVLIDDLELETGRALVQYLKLWLDIYAFKVEYKGGAKDVRPPYIIITSNFHPFEIFGEKQAAWYEPISRRLDIRWMGNPGETEPEKGPPLFRQPNFEVLATPAQPPAPVALTTAPTLVLWTESQLTREGTTQSLSATSVSVQATPGAGAADATSIQPTQAVIDLTDD